MSFILAKSRSSTATQHVIQLCSNKSRIKGVLIRPYPTPSRFFKSKIELQAQAGLAVKEDYAHNSGYSDVGMGTTRHASFGNQPGLGSDHLLPLQYDYILPQRRERPEIERVQNVATPMSQYHVGRESKFERVPYWQKIPRWKDVTEQQWLDYNWGVSYPSMIAHFAH